MNIKKHASKMTSKFVEHKIFIFLALIILGTIFLTIGMTAKIIEVRYGEVWSLAQVISYHKSSGGFYTDLFKMATDHTVGFSSSFITAIAISFTGFGFFMLAGIILFWHGGVKTKNLIQSKYQSRKNLKE